MLGSGGSGHVYEGLLPVSSSSSSFTVAVKLFSSATSLQTEMNNLQITRSIPSFIHLVGVSDDGSALILSPSCLHFSWSRSSVYPLERDVVEFNSLHAASIIDTAHSLHHLGYVFLMYCLFLVISRSALFLDPSDLLFLFVFFLPGHDIVLLTHL